MARAGTSPKRSRHCQFGPTTSVYYAIGFIDAFVSQRTEPLSLVVVRSGIVWPGVEPTAGFRVQLVAATMLPSWITPIFRPALILGLFPQAEDRPKHRSQITNTAFDALLHRPDRSARAATAKVELARTAPETSLAPTILIICLHGVGASCPINAARIRVVYCAARYPLCEPTLRLHGGTVTNGSASKAIPWPQSAFGAFGKPLTA